MEHEVQLARWLEKLQEYDFIFIIKHAKVPNTEMLMHCQDSRAHSVHGRGDLCGNKLNTQVNMVVDVVTPSLPGLYQTIYR